MMPLQLGPLEAPQCHVCKFTPSGEYLVRLLHTLSWCSYTCSHTGFLY